MNFGFTVIQVALLRPRQVLAALYWFLTGRKVRARNRLHLAVSQTPSAYPQWIANVEQLGGLSVTAPKVIANWNRHPEFTLLVHAGRETSDAAIQETLTSIEEQFYRQWELQLFVPERVRNTFLEKLGAAACMTAATAAEAFAKGIELARGEYVIPLSAGNKLSPAALFRIGEALQNSRPGILYGDEDCLRHGKRVQPWFKPQWNEELFFAQDYLSSACAVRTDLARAAMPFDQDFWPVAVYTTILRIATKSASEVRHIPHVLCHRSDGHSGPPQDSYVTTVAHHLASQNAEVGAGLFGSVRVTWPLPVQPPLVSIIVPTRDKVDLLRACVEGLLSNTTYPEFELIIVDNGSAERRTHAYLESAVRHQRVNVISYPGPYNYSAINNLAVAESKGNYVCLLNNDTQVIDGDWLHALMRQAMRPHIGAVGAKLLYSDGSIQHAGVVIGMGDAAGHAHRFLQEGKPGYFNMPHLPQYVSAVTGACMVVQKRKYEAVGGLDEDRLAVAFNDVDFCLKLEAAGWRNVYEPKAVLIHHESKSRGKDTSPKHIERYRKELAVLQERWGTTTYVDPLHNPNLSRATETFTIGIDPHQEAPARSIASQSAS